jgi:hypothetical protein
MAETTISKIYNVLTKDLADRQKDVIAGRFGVPTGEPQTLEAIGQKFGVTRERVRQIEATALSDMSQKLSAVPACMNLLEKGRKYLKTSGGVVSTATMVDYLKSDVTGLNENYLAVLLAVSKYFNSYDEDTDFKSFYYSDKDSLKNAVKLVSSWISEMNSSKDKVLAGGYDVHYKKFIKEKGIPASYMENCLLISKKIHSNPFGDKGLTSWPEIRPKTIRDRIYLVLKKSQKPEHFANIAQLVNSAKFDKKVALASTVHNELIKDERFVLVGRGMYGLSEFGFKPGTAKEVIKEVLKTGGPLRSKEIVLAVQKNRFFKYNTILVNLQNKDLFSRGADGKYTVREV